jgi:two-component system response regulator DesR
VASASPGAGLRLLVVDDHDVVGWGLRLTLGELSWVAECAVARTGDEALALARRVHPQVALVDLLLGRESGAELCERLRQASPDTRVLLLSGAGSISVAAARAVGASGFVPKSWSAADIARAVRLVALGREVFEADAQEGPEVVLSGREADVLELVAAGRTNREIASELFLSPHTVKEHTSALYRKLGVRNRTEAVQRAQRLGLLGVGPGPG